MQERLQNLAAEYGPVGGVAAPLHMPELNPVVEKFLATNIIEPHAAARLRTLPKEQQEAVMGGSLAGARNPTAVLIGRMRRVAGWIPAEYFPQRGMFQGPPGMPMAPAMMTSASSRPAETVASSRAAAEEVERNLLRRQEERRPPSRSRSPPASRTRGGLRSERSSSVVRIGGSARRAEVPRVGRGYAESNANEERRGVEVAGEHAKVQSSLAELIFAPIAPPAPPATPQIFAAAATPMINKPGFRCLWGPDRIWPDEAASGRGAASIARPFSSKAKTIAVAQQQEAKDGRRASPEDAALIHPVLQSLGSMHSPNFPAPEAPVPSMPPPPLPQGEGVVAQEEATEADTEARAFALAAFPETELDDFSNVPRGVRALLLDDVFDKPGGARGVVIHAHSALGHNAAVESGGEAAANEAAAALGPVPVLTEEQLLQMQVEAQEREYQQAWVQMQMKAHMALFEQQRAIGFGHPEANSDGPKIRRKSNQPMMPGDWECPKCGDHQFSRNFTCRACGQPRP